MKISEKASAEDLLKGTADKWVDAKDLANGRKTGGVLNIGDMLMTTNALDSKNLVPCDQTEVDSISTFAERIPNPVGTILPTGDSSNKISIHSFRPDGDAADGNAPRFFNAETFVFYAPNVVKSTDDSSGTQAYAFYSINTETDAVTPLKTMIPWSNIPGALQPVLWSEKSSDVILYCFPSNNNYTIYYYTFSKNTGTVSTNYTTRTISEFSSKASNTIRTDRAIMFRAGEYDYILAINEQDGEQSKIGTFSCAVSKDCFSSYTFISQISTAEQAYSGGDSVNQYCFNVYDREHFDWVFKHDGSYYIFLSSNNGSPSLFKLNGTEITFVRTYSNISGFTTNGSKFYYYSSELKKVILVSRGTHKVYLVDPESNNIEELSGIFWDALEQVASSKSGGRITVDNGVLYCSNSTGLYSVELSDPNSTQTRICALSTVNSDGALWSINNLLFIMQNLYNYSIDPNKPTLESERNKVSRTTQETCPGFTVVNKINGHFCNVRFLSTASSPTVDIDYNSSRCNIKVGNKIYSFIADSKAEGKEYIHIIKVDKACTPYIKHAYIRVK